MTLEFYAHLKNYLSYLLSERYEYIIVMSWRYDHGLISLHWYNVCWDSWYEKECKGEEPISITRKNLG